MGDSHSNAGGTRPAGAIESLANVGRVKAMEAAKIIGRYAVIVSAAALG